MAEIFNKSMSSGCVPQDWRDGILPQSSKRGNYRPISLTSIPCEVMESIINNQIVNHLVINSLLNKKQHGFMEHKSCVTNLLSFLGKITLESDNNIIIIINIYIFQKHLIKCRNKD